MSKVKMTKIQYLHELKAIVSRDLLKLEQLRLKQTLYTVKETQIPIKSDTDTQSYYYKKDIVELSYKDLNIIVQGYSLVSYHILFKSSHTQSIRQGIKENYEDCNSELKYLLLKALDYFLTEFTLKGITVQRQQENITDSGINTKIETVIIPVQVFELKDLSVHDVFAYLRKKVERPFLTWFNRTYTMTINNTFSGYEETYYDKDGNAKCIFDMLEDKASQLKFSDSELLESIKGTLTHTQYRILENIITGKGTFNSQKVGGSVIKSIKDKIYRMYQMNTGNTPIKESDDNFKEFIFVNESQYVSHLEPCGIRERENNHKEYLRDSRVAEIYLHEYLYREAKREFAKFNG